MYLTDLEIGREIKRRRVYANLTQADLGARIGVGAAAVNKRESELKNRKVGLKLKILMVTVISLNFPAIAGAHSGCV